MRTYLFKNPAWFSWPYREAVWRIPTDEKVINLTFDDGPDPEATPWVLDQLERYKAKATFFCVGQNAEKHPEIMRRIEESGHVIGNHTYSHKNGWKTDKQEYLEEVQKGEQSLKVYTSQMLFRPPYGNIRFSQLRSLKKAGYEVIMWSHLSGDFDPNVNIQKSIKSLKQAEPGSILVFHDSQKAFKNLQKMLPEVLKYLEGEGVVMRAVPDSIHSKSRVQLF